MPMRSIKMVKCFQQMSPAQRKKAIAKMQKPSAVWWATSKWVGLKPHQVKAAVEGAFKFACWQMAKFGSFKFAGMLKMTLRSKPPTKERKGKHMGKEVVFQAKAGRKTVRLKPLLRMNKLANKCYEPQSCR